MGYQQITRDIERYGILNLTQPQRRTARCGFYFDLLRAPSNRFLNYKYRPEKSWYGVAQIMAGFRVLAAVPLEFPNQLIWEYQRPDYESLVSISCSLKNLVLPLYTGLNQFNPGNRFPTSISFASSLVFPYMPVTQVRLRLYNNAMVRLFYEYNELLIPCENSTFPPFEEPREYGRNQPLTPRNPTPGIDEDDPPPSPPYQGPNDSGLTYVRPGAGGGTPGQKVSIAVNGTYRDRESGAFIDYSDTPTDCNSTDIREPISAPFLRTENGFFTWFVNATNTAGETFELPITESLAIQSYEPLGTPTLIKTNCP